VRRGRKALGSLKRGSRVVEQRPMEVIMPNRLKRGLLLTLAGTVEPLRENASVMKGIVLMLAMWVVEAAYVNTTPSIGGKRS
jgi:hypothetical protein